MTKEIRYVRGPFGKLVKGLFIIFNLFMAFCLVTIIWNIVDAAPSNAADPDGNIIFLTIVIGSFTTLSFWAVGTIVLSPLMLLTRRSVVYEES